MTRSRRSSEPFPASAVGEGLADVLAEVRRIELETRRLVTDVLAGGYRSTFRGVGVEVAEVREFVEGDDLRAVDWNVTARQGRPFVKRYVEERERTLVFVLDLSTPMACGLGAWSMRQVAARFLAILGLAAIDNHDRVGLCAGGGEVERFVPPRRGGGHVLRIVRDCISLPVRGAGAIDALLQHVGARLRRRAVVFVLSPFLGEQLRAALVACHRRHDVVAVRLLPRELVDPPRALLHVADPFGGLPAGGSGWCDFRSERVRTAYQARVAECLARHDDELRRVGIDGIDVVTPAVPDARALAQPLLRFFRRRELREVRR